jgi:hypothetical protein
MTPDMHDLGLERAEPASTNILVSNILCYMAAKPMTVQASVLASALAAGLMLTVAS